MALSSASFVFTSAFAYARGVVDRHRLGLSQSAFLLSSFLSIHLSIDCCVELGGLTGTYSAAVDLVRLRRAEGIRPRG